MKNTKGLFMVLGMISLIACTTPTKQPERQLSNVEKIKKHSELALKKCDKGNVKEVTINGFQCFK